MRSERLRGLAPLLLLLLLTPLGACFMYVPVGVEPPPPGARIRAALADSAAARLVSRLGPGVTQIEGALVDAQPQELSLAVDRYRTAQLGPVSWTGDVVRLSRAGVRDLEQRRFSRARTAIFVGAIALGGMLLNHSLLAGGHVPTDESQQPQNPF